MIATSHKPQTNLMRAAFRATVAAALAISLGACRGLPDAQLGHDASYAIERAPVASAPIAPPPVAAASFPPSATPAEVIPAQRQMPAHEPQTVPVQQTPAQQPTNQLPLTTHHSPSDFTPSVARVQHLGPLPPGLPASAYTGDVYGMTCCNDPFYPPEVWPRRREEFLCDGGDQKLRVEVNPDWTVRGLDQEDTVVHFDTLAGETHIKPSNCVCIYAPRFAAVRKTVGLSLARVQQKSAGVETPIGLAQQEDVNGANTVIQPLQPGRNIGLDQVVTFIDRNLGVELERTRIVAGLENGFMPYENLQLIRAGQFDQSEKVRLANSIEAAVTWTDNQSVQVIVDGKQAIVQKGLVAAEVLDTSEPQGEPCMRIIKVASRKDALPGEIVHFTLRFDNTGTQEVGNVTIIDHLTQRLEYVQGSAECSLPANFIATDDEGESLILRWEITDPIKPGEGGIIRFQCRVR